MASLKTLFIAEKLGTYPSKCTTIIADEALARSHAVFECLPQDISLTNSGLICKATPYPRDDEEIPPQEFNMEYFDVIHFRPNPPVDMTYLSTLYMLKTIEDKVLIANSPTAIINFPEKILPHFFDEFSPPTLITKDIDAGRKFLSQHKTIIAKPLYEFGGSNIHKISFEKKSHLENLIIKSETPLVLQKFLPEISEGDKRILFISGEIAGVFTRIPEKNNFLANTAQGATIHSTELTKHENQVAEKLTKFLQENHIYLCGIDVIGNHITEINLTSPSGFQHIETLYNKCLEKDLWDKLEQDIK